MNWDMIYKFAVYACLSIAWRCEGYSQGQEDIALEICGEPAPIVNGIPACPMDDL